MCSRPLATLLLCATTLLPLPALAAWPHVPTANLPVCVAPGQQTFPAIVSDGSGGAILAWQDTRADAGDIYAQHVLASGVVDPAWPAAGRALCTAAGGQSGVVLVSDGAGGAIASWGDARTDAGDIYAQHVLATGAVDPAWPVNGRAVCASANTQANPALVADGAGGALVCWQDFRSGTLYHIFAHHVLASGALDPAWPAAGRNVCNAAGGQTNPILVSDLAGGAILAWKDQRTDAGDIYAQHVLSTGAVDGAWPANGQVLCNAAGAQVNPVIVSDGSGGALVAWSDARSDAGDIYAQHVLGNGIVDYSWPANGQVLCAANNAQSYPAIATDGQNGAYVTWLDGRPSTGSYYHVYAQHVLAQGSIDPNYPNNGLAVCTATNFQFQPSIVPDGGGGAVVAWEDDRSDPLGDIYAQHILPGGTVDPAWPVNGRAVSTAPGTQGDVGSAPPAMAPDGSGGVILAWDDGRALSDLADIYAQRVESHGRLGDPGAAFASVKDVPYDQGGHVKASWYASYLDGAPYDEIAGYDVWRSLPPQAARKALGQGARLLRAGERAAGRAGRVLRAAPSAAGTTFWEYVGSEPAHHLAGYSFVVGTSGDSVSGGNPQTYVMIEAVDRDGTSSFLSLADSGYSVDNLPPAEPAPFNGVYSGGVTTVHWRENTEPDLGHYNLYRGTTAAFVPGPANLLAARTDTSYVDATPGGHFYKLSAVDVHGNESPFHLLTPQEAGAVAAGPAAGTWLAGALPNPSRGSSLIRYGLATAGNVDLSVYDAGGALVRRLVHGRGPAGDTQVSWDGRDAGGAPAPAGVYFYRLAVDGGTPLTRRLVRVR